MKDFRTVTLADQVFERLESDIIQGVYPRGEVLTELRLVEQLNVSRTPIREALRRLQRLAQSAKEAAADAADAAKQAAATARNAAADKLRK